MTLRQRPFHQIDVFTGQPYRGNPLAVVLDGTGLSTEAMQAFTCWTNLSEATFVLPPTPEGRAAGADYRVRIFCPTRELPFAGHPTLGTCHAWLSAGGQPQEAGQIVQECGVGLVTLRPQGDCLAFTAPPLLRDGPLDEGDLALIAQALGIAREDIIHHAWCDNGPTWRGVMLRSAQQVLDLRPDTRLLAGWDVGVVGPYANSSAPRTADGEAIALEVRAFFPGANGWIEDPVTGSLNAALGQWLIGAGLVPSRYIARQGTRLQRAGQVYVDKEGDTVWVGGQSVTCMAGQVLL